MINNNEDNRVIILTVVFVIWFYAGVFIDHFNKISPLFSIFIGVLAALSAIVWERINREV